MLPGPPIPTANISVAPKSPTTFNFLAYPPPPPPEPELFKTTYTPAPPPPPAACVSITIYFNPAGLVQVPPLVI